MVIKDLNPLLNQLIPRIARFDPPAIIEFAEVISVLITARTPPTLSAGDREKLRTTAMVEISAAAGRLTSMPADPGSWVQKKIDAIAHRQARFIGEDRDRAAAAQRHMLLPKTFEAHGMEVAVEVRPYDLASGDVFDYSVTPRDALFALVDIAGKGPAASTLAAYSLAHFRTQSKQTRDPRKLTNGLNNSLFAATAPSESAAVAIARWTPAGRLLQISNAGYPLPLLIRERSVRRLGDGGQPVGLFPSGRFSVSRTQPCPGDLILLASDGISEQKTNTDRYFNTASIARSLASSPTASMEALMAQSWQIFAQRTGRRIQHDDRTIAIIRFS